MKQKRFVLGSMLIVLLVAVGLPSLLTYREYQQQRRNKALIAAIYRNNAQAVVSLLKQGANANTRDDHSPPPTLSSVLEHFLDRLRHKQSALMNETEHSALMVAVWDYYRSVESTSLPENVAVVQALLEHGADFENKDERGCSVLLYATFLNHAKVVRLLLEHGSDPNVRDHSGGTVLFTPHFEVSVSLARLLLDRGLDPNATNICGQTALLSNSGFPRDIQLVELLLERGAEVDWQDGTGETALWPAVELNNLAGVRLLLAHGAKVSLKNKVDRTVLDVARDKKNTVMIRLLEQAQAK